jgi:hypothetical protein
MSIDNNLIKPVAKWKYLNHLKKVIKNVTSKFATNSITEKDVQRVNTWFSKLEKYIKEGL